MNKTRSACATALFALWTTAAVAQHPLWAIDQQRASVVQRIVSEWTPDLSQLPAARRMSAEQLADALFGLRSDRLLAASLAGSFATIEALIAESQREQAENPRSTRVVMKNLGDADADLTYTPVTPCRLVETRGTFAAVFQGGGAFASNEIHIQPSRCSCTIRVPAMRSCRNCLSGSKSAAK
jgi:hypothetical protein